jgi:prevent-host-death family protein
MLDAEGKFMEIVPITRAKARFSEIIARLIHRKKAVLITRKRTLVAAIVPYAEWAEREASKQEGLAAAAGALADFDADIDELIEAVYDARAKAKDREVLL